MKIFSGVIVASLLVSLASAESVNAVEKVVELLRNLRAEVEEEGKADAATYDKFACFCKEQATDKQWAIEQSQARIDRLTEEIAGLTATKVLLDNEITTLDETRNNSRSDMELLKNSQKALDTVHKRQTKQRETDIKLVEKAMARMEQTKNDVSSAALVQLAKAHGEHQIAKTLSSAPGAGGAGFGEDATGAGSGAQYAYSSDTVNAALRKFLYILKDSMERAETAWREKSEALEVQWREKQTIMEQAHEALEKKEGERAKVEVRIEEKTKDKDDEITAQGQDQDFIGQLQIECRDEATQWDTDSNNRAGEIKALTEAIEALTEENPDQNTREQGNKVADRYEATNMAASFLQRRSSTEEEAMATLGRAVLKLKSASFASIRLKINMMGKSASRDHFVKVREIISKLIEDLKTALQQSDSDASTCAGAQSSVNTDKGLASASMASNQQDLLAAQREIAAKEARLKTLQKEKTQISEEENERTELRAEQQKAWDEARPKLQEGIDAVQKAIQVLEQYYGAGLLQTEAEPWRATNSDRDGNTVRSLAPKRAGYENKGDQSKSILALLRTILSDFQTSKDDRKLENDIAIAKFDQEQLKNERRKRKIDAATNNAEGIINTKKGEVETATDNIADASGDYDAAVKTLNSAPCPKQETWDERSAARQAEIEQLKAALEILEKRDNVVDVASR